VSIPTDNLNELSLVELKEKAKAVGVKGYSTMNKTKLKAAIKKALK
jgi:hypothetical protein